MCKQAELFHFLPRVVAAVATAGFLLSAGAAFAFPDKPVRFIVPFPPGGANDILARTLGPRLTADWAQPVVIENRPGAGGNIGADVVAKAKPDGHTLLLGYVGNLTISPSLYQAIPYDTLKDFAPVTNLVNQPIVMLAHPNFAASTIKQLVALAKARRGEITCASPGVGTAQHLATELLKTKAGIDLVHVPYKGAIPALTDLIGGQIPLLTVGLAPALPHVKSGKLKALAVVGPKRAAVLPEVPTVGETVAGFEVTSWNGVLVPSGTPAAVVGQLNRDVVRVLAEPDVRARLEAAGFEIIGNSPEQFARTIRGDLARFASVIRVSGIKPE
jgi:tripartite-type tricarboxylate transporter receptor subunit TctC